MFGGLFKHFLDQILLGIKLRVVSIALKIITGLRAALLFVVAVIVAAMMGSIALFSGIAYALYQMGQQGRLVWDPVLIFCLCVFGVSAIIFSSLMCERTWLKAVKIDKWVEELGIKRC